MKQINYVRPEKVLLKTHPELNELWVQSRIAEDPTILGLGDLVLKDRERPQPGAGRLDLLLQDAETYHRYEVEVQLGSTDETHIIRTLEYWDIERKRYPQYEHTAVIVAEDITSRFLNIISLFNGFIPLVANQMNALRVGEHLTLVFTTVLDEMSLGLVDEDEEVQAETNRAYWEARGTRKTIGMADELHQIIRDQFDPQFDFKYNKYYIGLAKNGQPNNFVIFRPQKNALRLEVRVPRTDTQTEELEAAGLDVMEYDRRFRYYRIRLTKEDLQKQREFLTELMRKAYEHATG